MNSILNPCIELTNSKRYPLVGETQIPFEHQVEVWLSDMRWGSGRRNILWDLECQAEAQYQGELAFQPTHTERLQPNCKVKTNYCPLLQTKPLAPQASEMLSWRSCMRESAPGAGPAGAFQKSNNIVFRDGNSWWVEALQVWTPSVNNCVQTQNKSLWGSIQGSSPCALKHYIPNHRLEM